MSNTRRRPRARRRHDGAGVAANATTAATQEAAGRHGSRPGRRGRLAASVLILFVVTACDWLTVPPLIESFVADPAVAGVGESVTLSWSVVGAESLRLMPGGADVSGSSSLAVAPLATTTYELVARNAAGSVSREVEVVVEPEAPVITSFVANPAAVVAGADVTLSWSVAGATTLLLMPGGVDVSGASSLVVEPMATTTYELVAEGDGGSATREVEVLVGDPPAIVSFASDRGLVNPGLDVTLTWSVTGADTLVLLGPGLGSGVSVAGTTERTVTASEAGATYTLVAGSPFGEAEDDLQVARDVNAVSVLVAGQSNAMGYNLRGSAATAFIAASPGVMMLGNDDVWKPAAEPLDDPTNQVDAQSADNNVGVSAGVSLGNSTVATTGGEAFLIPAASGGSLVSEWLPLANRYDRATLFGSAAHRGRLAGLERWAPLGHDFGDQAFGAVYWYQGESNANTDDSVDFVPQTQAVLDAFQEELDAPIILAQLARRGSGSVPGNLYFQRLREAQRSFETGARTPAGAAAAAARERTHLVVTHDLPMHDDLHLSAPGQKELGRRISLAIRQHLFGEDVDGSGPRLVRVEKLASNTVVLVHADRPLTSPVSTGPSAYSGYFTLIASGESVPIASIQRDAVDPKVVRITLASAVAGAVEVRYMPPPVRLTAVAADVIRSFSCAEPMPVTGLCLPMPAFGAAASTTELAAMSTYVDEVYE